MFVCVLQVLLDSAMIKRFRMLEVLRSVFPFAFESQTPTGTVPPNGRPGGYMPQAGWPLRYHTTILTNMLVAGAPLASFLVLSFLTRYTPSIRACQLAQPSSPSDLAEGYFLLYIVQVGPIDKNNLPACLLSVCLPTTYPIYYLLPTASLPCLHHYRIYLPRQIRDA